MGTGTIVGADIDAGSTDACGIATRIVAPNTFTCNDVGPNNVTLTVTDNNGNVNTCLAVVTVEETTPPVISCPNDTSVTAAAGSCSAVVNGIAPVADDNCGVSTITYRMLEQLREVGMMMPVGQLSILVLPLSGIK